MAANPPPAQRAEALLDLQASREARLATYNEGRHDDDLQRQLFFLTNSFQGVTVELEHALSMMAALMPMKPAHRIEVPRKGDGNKGDGAKEQEKALFRLSMIGVVDDYTVDYGAKKFVVDLDNFNAEHIDRAMLAFVARVEPGKTAHRRRELVNAPADLHQRMEHHLRMLLTTLYNVVEPSRVRALSEIHQLCLLGDDEEGIRARILAYLSDGPLAGILLQLASSQSVDVREVIRSLDTVPAEDPREWVGAAARQLEAYPDHPVLLMVRALGEAMLKSGDPGLVRESAAAAFRGLASYGVTASEAAVLFGWATAQLRNQHDGRGWIYVPYWYEAWDEAGLDGEALEGLEARVLEMVARGEFHSDELEVVLTRRLTRHAARAEKFTDLRTMTMETSS